jgi:hypothetical protein
MDVVALEHDRALDARPSTAGRVELDGAAPGPESHRRSQLCGSALSSAYPADRQLRRHHQRIEEPGSLRLPDITRQQKAELRELGYTDDQIRGMKPEEAHRVLGLIDDRRPA